MSTEELLISFEQKLHDPKIRKNQKQLELLLSDDFFEFGSSGNIWNKKQVIEDLLKESSRHISAFDFKVLKLSDDDFLITYKTKDSLRSSIWKKNNHNWQMVFHQGTKISS